MLLILHRFVFVFINLFFGRICSCRFVEILRFFVGSYVAFISQKKLSGCCRRCSDLQNKYICKWHSHQIFRSFAFVVEIVWYFSGVVCEYDFYVLLLKTNFNVLKRCKISNLYSLYSIVIEDENPLLNRQRTLPFKQSMPNF